MIPRQGASPRWNRRPIRPEKNTSWILWSLIGILVVAAISVVAWRLQYQAKWRQSNEQVLALLESAEQLIQANREDEAEAVVTQGIGLLPGDNRCQEMINRINTKRAMIHLNKTKAAGFMQTQAEELSKTDIPGAIETYDKMIADKSLTPEAHQTAKARIAELQGGVCSLRMPNDWPEDAVLTIDSVTKYVTKGLVSAITPGKHTFLATRHGFRDVALELEFRGLDPLQLPAIVWKTLGAKVFLKSNPSGAAVWRSGNDTGKITPCTIEDVDDGPVEFILKHPKYAETSVKAEVKDRKPLSLTTTLTPR